MNEFKMNVHLEPMDGLHMSDYDFECAFYVYTNRKVVISCRIPSTRAWWA